jgi:hypothetical protein
VNYFVLHVRPYSFRDDSNRLVEGASVTYLDLTNEPDEGEKGFAPLTISASPEKLKAFTEVPGYYELNFSQRRGAKGRPQIVFDRARLVAGAELSLEHLAQEVDI